MSCGALKLGEGRYLNLANKSIQAEDFERVEYISANQLLTQGLRIPESFIPEINRIIGRFLVAIQEASFVHRGILSVVSQTDYTDYCDEPYGDETCVYGSTLSANTLVATIRQNIANAVRDVLALMPDLNAAKSMEEGEDKTQKPFTKNATLAFSDGVSHDGELGRAELLTVEARKLIDQFGEGCADVIHDLLRKIGEAILCRADLSYPSISCDVTRLSQGQKTDLPEEAKKAQYSTLNPTDLIERMKRQLEFYPAGFIFNLPDEIKERILSRIPKKEAEPVQAST